MWLILCGSTDMSALWAYQGLKARGFAPLELVTSEMLAYSLGWEHRIGEAGAQITVQLADGRSLSSDKIFGVLNRLFSVHSNHFQAINTTDRTYATQEFVAFFMGWLQSLPHPILNLPTPQGLSGQWRHASEWVWLATRAGLPAPSYRQTSHEVQPVEIERRLVPAGTPTTTVFVVGGHVVGMVPSAVARGCRQLSRLANTDLLGIEFTHSLGSPWMFAGATPYPDLSLGGQPLLDALALALQGKWEEGE